MNIEIIKTTTFNDFKITKPYPEITLDSLNANELSIIKNIYAGTKGELTSANQYIYQHILLYYTEELKNFSDSMEEISITEMIHTEMLGKIILKSNKDPRFCTFIDNNPNICNYWSASYINYSTNIKEILEKNLELENVAIREYKRLLEITSNENLKEIITRILEDEYSHVEYFTLLLKSI